MHSTEGSAHSSVDHAPQCTKIYDRAAVELTRTWARCRPLATQEIQVVEANGHPRNSTRAHHYRLHRYAMITRVTIPSGTIAPADRSRRAKTLRPVRGSVSQDTDERTRRVWHSVAQQTANASIAWHRIVRSARQFDDRCVDVRQATPTVPELFRATLTPRVSPPDLSATAHRTLL